MKTFIVLAVVLSIAFCGFNIPGVYSVVGGDCNVYQCPVTYTTSGQYSFACPWQGNNNVELTYNSYSGYYTLKMRTDSPGASGGYLEQIFNSSAFVTDPYTGDQQIQLPLANGYVLNLQPCYRGTQTSYLCPSSPYQSQKSMVGWKTYNGQAPQQCSFVLQRNN